MFFFFFFFFFFNISICETTSMKWKTKKCPRKSYIQVHSIYAIKIIVNTVRVMYFADAFFPKVTRESGTSWKRQSFLLGNKT